MALKLRISSKHLLISVDLTIFITAISAPLKYAFLTLENEYLKCRYCGEQIQEKVNFCPLCGSFLK